MPKQTTNLIAGPSAEAYRCVNIVRNRVGLRDLPAGLNQVQFREAILTERVCEFAVEEIRWFDLVRWKRESDFTKTSSWNEYQSDPRPLLILILILCSNLPSRYWQKDWSPKWYFSAYPLAEIQKGYGLVQNPGWE